MKIRQLYLELVSVSGVLVLLCSCASTQVTAFKDPEFSTRAFSRPAVYAKTSNLRWRQSLEETMVEEMTKQGMAAEATIHLIPPTRDYSSEERVQILLSHEMDSLVVVEIGHMGVEKVYRPPTGATTKTYQGTSTTTFTGGYNFSKPWANMSTYVLDLESGKKAWVASSFTGGTAYTSFKHVRRSYCESIAEKMLEHRIIESAWVKISNYLLDLESGKEVWPGGDTGSE